VRPAKAIELSAFASIALSRRNATARLFAVIEANKEALMKPRTIAAALSVTFVCAAVTLATIAAPPRESVVPQFKHELPNVPGKSLTAVVVEYAPGGKSVSHRHAKSAFIYAYVLAGEVRSQVDETPPKVYRAGESFFELPGQHHRMSENASSTQPAKLLAVFVSDTGEKLTTPDQP
jgi:quercetin dioxygenase-like cupin family protein